jgi:peptidase MA superfamily protein
MPTAVQVGRVTAVAWPAQRAIAADLARAADRPAEWPGLGRREPGPLRLIVVPDGRTLDSLTSGRAPAWGAAVAEPGERTILLRADQDDLLGTLRHELAHLALHEAVPVRVPLWFDEGYAAWAAGEWERFGGLELNLAVVRGAIPSLTALDGALRGSASTADAAYALAASAVTELARRNPTGTLTPLLQRLERGEDFDAAVLATTGLSPDRFDEEWRRTVRKRYTLGQWLVAGGGWTVMAILVLWLVRRRRRVDRARRAALDVGWVVESETEEGPELDPPPKP